MPMVWQPWVLLHRLTRQSIRTIVAWAPGQRQYREWVRSASRTRQRGRNVRPMMGRRPHLLAARRERHSVPPVGCVLVSRARSPIGGWPHAAGGRLRPRGGERHTRGPHPRDVPALAPGCEGDEPPSNPLSHLTPPRMVPIHGGFLHHP